MSRKKDKIGWKEWLALAFTLGIALFCFYMADQHRVCTDADYYGDTITIQESWICNAGSRFESPTAWIRSTDGDLYYVRCELFSRHYESCYSHVGTTLEVLVDTHWTYRERDTGEKTSRQIVAAACNGTELFGVEDENHIRAANRLIAILFGVLFSIPSVFLILLGFFIFAMRTPLSKPILNFIRHLKRKTERCGYEFNVMGSPETGYYYGTTQFQGVAIGIPGTEFHCEWGNTSTLFSFNIINVCKNVYHRIMEW